MITPSDSPSPITFNPGTHVHIVGIGGAGMSAIARILIGRGCHVTGSDRQPSPLLDALAAEQIGIYIGHAAEQIGVAQIVLISSAVPIDNPEVVAAHKAGLPVLKRREALGALTANYDVIAVAGTHGKTTTSALIAYLLTELGFDPTYLIGGTLLNSGTNAHVGKSRWFVIEADEYDGMFLGLNPLIAVITNIEHDHPDLFPTLEDVQATFRAFVDRIRPDGVLIACQDDLGVWSLAVSLQSVGQSIAGYQEVGINVAMGCPTNSPGADWLRSPHNRLNLGAAMVVLDHVGADRDRTLAALCDFRGVGRRMEKLGATAKGVTIFSDYGHHPTAIRSTLQGARERFPDAKLWAVWQPHTYSRTNLLAHEFAESFGAADHALITDIYAAREQPTPGANPATIADLARAFGHPDVRASGDLMSTTAILAAEAESGDVVIIFSAGDAPGIAVQLLANKS